MEYSTCQSGCKIAVLCKNRRCGNCNAHKCALPRATLGFCTSTAQRICTISSSTDKNSCHNFVKLSAWWLAYARYFCCGNCNAHKCALPRATLGFCTSTAQRICTISSSTDKNSCHNFVKLSAWWLAYARYFCCGNCNAHKCALPRATLGFCTSTAQRICTISSSTDKNSCHNFVKLSACWLAYARCFQSSQRFLQELVSPVG